MDHNPLENIQRYGQVRHLTLFFCSLLDRRCIVLRKVECANFRSLLIWTTYRQYPLVRQETPTPYNYSLIDVPVYLFWSKSDFLTTPLEVEQVLMKELRPEVVKVPLSCYFSCLTLDSRYH